jgi:CrcB protein
VLQLLFISLGGAAGTAARYLVSGYSLRVIGTSFPYGTLLVNFSGSLLLSLIMHVALVTDALSPTVRLTLTTGFMGGYTTYSTFNYETLRFLTDGSYALACLNLFVTVAGCLIGGWLGLVGGRLLVGD